MLYKQFDYSVAYFDDATAVDPEEYAAADLAIIGGYHPQGIYHSTHMRWLCVLNGKSSTDVIHSHKDRSRLQKNRQYFLDRGFTFAVKQMNETDFYEFQELYQNTTQKKERAIKHNLADRVLGRIVVGIPVYCVGMYKENTLISGLVFTVNSSNNALVSYGAKQKFQEVTGGVGGTLEWELLKYCEQHHIHSIDHGKNSNPVGLANKSGLFEFKARYGNSAFPEGRWVTTFIKNPKILQSDAVFVTTINDKVGYVVVSDQEVSEKKYVTNEVSNIKILPLSQVIQTAQSAF